MDGGEGGGEALDVRSEQLEQGGLIELVVAEAQDVDGAPLQGLALRIRKRQGQLFGGGYDTKYLAVVSNRRELAAPALIRWHWEKAGTIERVHDVTKIGLLGRGGGRLPAPLYPPG